MNPKCKAEEEIMYGTRADQHDADADENRTY